MKIKSLVKTAICLILIATFLLTISGCKEPQKVATNEEIIDNMRFFKTNLIKSYDKALYPYLVYDYNTTYLSHPKVGKEVTDKKIDEVFGYKIKECTYVKTENNYPWIKHYYEYNDAHEKVNVAYSIFPDGEMILTSFGLNNYPFYYGKFDKKYTAEETKEFAIEIVNEYYKDYFNLDLFTYSFNNHSNLDQFTTGYDNDWISPIGITERIQTHQHRWELFKNGIYLCSINVFFDEYGNLFTFSYYGVDPKIYDILPDISLEECKEKIKETVQEAYSENDNISNIVFEFEEDSFYAAERPNVSLSSFYDEIYFCVYANYTVHYKDGDTKSQKIVAAFPFAKISDYYEVPEYTKDDLMEYSPLE